MKILCAVLTLLFCFAVANAQTETKGEATIFVYRNFYHTTFGRSAPTVTINGEKIAVIDEGRYFAARTAPGFVVVSCGKKKENRVEVETVAGGVYYFRIRAHPGTLFARFELFRVTIDEVKRDAEKLRHIESRDIKSDRVIKGAQKPQ